MSLQLQGYIDLPDHIKQGGFDHAAVHRRTSRLYVAHPGNDAIDVLDCANDKFLHSIPNLIGVAGALVSDERNLIFTSNRGENTVGIFSPDDEASLIKVAVGVKPNGLSRDPQRNILLAANVGDPALADSFTVSIVDVEQKKMIASVPVAGRTRWTIFDSRLDCFFVNIAEPFEIAVIEANTPTKVSRTYPIPIAGPHGLDSDANTGRLFCACDGKKLVTLESGTGKVMDAQDIGGIPDVIFFNAQLNHLYVTIGDPGIIEVFDTRAMKRIETVSTEKGAHTIGYDVERNKVYAFLPATHRAVIYVDR
ncbi:MAG: hypothetical protein HZC38_11895 [Chloroflexi bacterium]|nr:hypothetical protein [Chloroflexota bacterium]MBI5714106.1 hypothetical protein [Chloroflexota bacterium]